MGAALSLAVVVEEPFAEGREKFEGLVAYLESGEARELTHSDLERELEVRGRELLRSLYQGYLDSRTPGEAREGVCDAEGAERTRKRVQGRDLETVFGTVRIERTGYGREGSASLHPLDAELNLPIERYSHEVRRRAAEEASKSSFDERDGADGLSLYGSAGAEAPGRGAGGAGRAGLRGFLRRAAGRSECQVQEGLSGGRDERR